MHVLSQHAVYPHVSFRSLPTGSGLPADPLHALEAPAPRSLRSEAARSPLTATQASSLRKQEVGAPPPLLWLLLILGAALLAVGSLRSRGRQRSCHDDLLPPQPVLPRNPHTALHDRRYLRAILEAERQKSGPDPQAASAADPQADSAPEQPG